MIIDGHAHKGGRYRELESIISTLDHNHVDKAILVPSETEREGSMWLPYLVGRIGGKILNALVNRIIRNITSREKEWHYIERTNVKVFDLASASEGRVIQFFWANPLSEGIIEEIREKHSQWNFNGIKLHQCTHPFHIRSEQFYHIAGLAQELKLPVFIHLYSKKEIIDFIEISGNYATSFIVGHLIGLEYFRKYKASVSDNIFFDISCPPLVAARRVKRAINEFGTGRVVMGSDTPYGRNNLEAVISMIHSLDIDETDKDRILGLNLKEIMGS